MILIYDTDIARAMILRSDMLKVGIPCAVYNSEAHTPAHVNIVFTDVVANFASVLDTVDHESVLYCDGTADRFDIERFRLYNRVLDLLDVKYGVNPDSFYRARFMRIGKETRYCGKLMLLTETEILIATHLEFCDRVWCSARELAAYCLKKPDDMNAISSHITSINKKSCNCSLVRFIETRRNSGYRCTFREIGF